MTKPAKVGHINSTSAYRGLLAQLNTISMRPEGLNTSEQQGEH